MQKKCYDRITLLHAYVNMHETHPLRYLDFLPLNLKEINSTDAPYTSPYTYESHPKLIFKHLVVQYLYITLRIAYRESSMAVQKARLVSMSTATDNATALLKTLHLTYNRTRQAMVTREMIDLINGTLAA